MDSTGEGESSGPGSIPGGFKYAIRGLDTNVVIMKVGQTTRIYYRGNKPKLTWANDIAAPPYSYSTRTNLSGMVWAFDIGPSPVPVTTSFTIDGVEVPVIITE